MHARSALFDVYGDHLRQRGGMAPIASLVALLEPLGFRAPAVRTAVSRMVKQGWLVAVDVAGLRGYALTARAEHRLDEAGARIYRTRQRDWDGRLDVVLFSPPAERRRRSQLTAALRFHGYGPLSAGAWMSPWAASELPSAFEEAGVEYERFSSAHRGDTAALARQAWDVDELAGRYRDFVAEFDPIVGLVGAGTPDEVAYTARFRLVHAFRVFLFSDPQLPPELCPHSWAGGGAAAFFDVQAARLRPAADRYVDRCLQRNENTHV
ncbi:MAG: PaaX family transcriptional regulator [Stackebrandtia sp.]